MASMEAAQELSVTSLLQHGLLNSELAGLIWLLAGARVPILVAGGPDLRPARTAVRDALTVLADPALRRFPVGPGGEGLEGLRAPDAATTLLMGIDLDERPAPPLRVPFKALARGADLFASIEAVTLEDVIARLRRWDIGLSDDELTFIGVVLVVGRVVSGGSPTVRLTAAHYVRPLARDPAGHVQRSGPAVLATWEPTTDRFEDFSWGIAAELAGRAGLRPGDLELETERRGAFLSGLSSSGVVAPGPVAAALAAYGTATPTGHPDAPPQ